MSIFLPEIVLETTEWEKLLEAASPMLAPSALKNYFVQERESEGEDDYVVFLFDEYYLVSTCIGVVLLGQFFTG